MAGMVEPAVPETLGDKCTAAGRTGTVRDCARTVLITDLRREGVSGRGSGSPIGRAPGPVWGQPAGRVKPAGLREPVRAAEARVLATGPGVPEGIRTRVVVPWGPAGPRKARR